MVETNKLPRLSPQKKEPDEEKVVVPFKKAVVIFVQKYLFLLFIPFFIAYILVCYKLENQMQANIYACFKEIGANGFGVTYKPPRFSFLRTKLGLYIDDLIIKAPAHFGGWTLKTGRLTVSSGPFSPDKIRLNIQGTHLFSTKNKRDYRFQISKGDILFRLPDKKETAGFEIELENLSSSGNPLFKLENFSLSLKEIREKIDDLKAYDYSLRLDRLMLPTHFPFPPEMEFLYAQGVLRGITPKRQKPLLDDWLSNSGTIDITKGEMIWHPLMSEFSATIGLTPSFNVILASSAKMYGFFSFLSFLEKKGVLKNSDYSVAKIVLGQKLKMEAGESQPSLTSPFSMQFGKLYVGQVLLYDFNETNKKR